MEKTPLPSRKTGQRRAGLALMLAGGILLLVIAAQFATQSVQVSPTGPLSPGTTLADFTLSDLLGKTVRLTDFRGQVVLVNTWATWCPPCRSEMPGINAYYQAHRSAGFVVLAINAGETAQQAADFSNELGLSFPVLLDPEEILMDKFRIDSFPTSILLDRQGKIRGVHIGYYDPDLLARDITPLLSE